MGKGWMTGRGAACVGGLGLDMGAQSVDELALHKRRGTAGKAVLFCHMPGRSGRRKEA